MIAITNKTWIAPPKVFELTNPTSHNTKKITPKVISMTRLRLFSKI